MRNAFWAVIAFCLLSGSPFMVAIAAEETATPPGATAAAPAADDRAVAEIMSRWKKEISPQQRKFLVSELEAIGTRRAFFEMVKIACEDASPDVRSQAARWIAKQDNREEAIPQFVKYLNNKKFFHNALRSLGYTEIAKEATRKDPELVAALIDNLITVIPRRSWTYVYSWEVQQMRLGSATSTWGHSEVNRVPIVKYDHLPNEDTRTLLYQYTSQDYEYDQRAWRKNVLAPLRKGDWQR
ncbi:MAG TPA: HEAT repeat domain-containing protein [Pirellulaceae bacterium]|nr:HEAT repeat domain-containing protein [Pirellulaceae bacterium]